MAHTRVEFYQVDVRSVSMAQGWGWIATAGGYFAGAPAVWALMGLVWLIAMAVLTFIPFVGPLVAAFLMPVLAAGFVLAARKQDEGGPVQVGDLLIGFSHPRSAQLLTLGALSAAAQLAMMIITWLLTMLFVGAAAGGVMMGADPGAAAAGAGVGMVLVWLLALALWVPLVMALWFAPALVVLRGMSALDALKRSFEGCLENIGAFLLFGVIALAISFVALLPFGLGMVVWGPVLGAAVYSGYCDIYR